MIRQLLTITAILFLLPISARAQDTARIEQDIREIKQLLVNLHYQENLNQQVLNENLGFIDSTNTELAGMLQNTNRGMKQLKATNDSLAKELAMLNTGWKNHKKRSIYFEIGRAMIGAILLLLISFLVGMIINIRRQSLDYLLSRANELSDQNSELLIKVEELKSVKQNLKEIVKAKKKAKKKDKKKKK